LKNRKLSYPNENKSTRQFRRSLQFIKSIPPVVMGRGQYYITMVAIFYVSFLCFATLVNGSGQALRDFELTWHVVMGNVSDSYSSCYSMYSRIKSWRTRLKLLKRELRRYHLVLNEWWMYYIPSPKRADLPTKGKNSSYLRS